MATIILRQGVGGKGSPLTNAEVDANFTNLNTDKIENADAVSTNTANKVVKRDASGNFNAGTITASLTGNVTGNVSGSSGSCTGNALTATTLQTARTINGVSFDGSANITVTADANTLTGTTLKSTVVSSSLTSVGTISTGVWQGTDIGLAHGGTNATLTAVAGGIVYSTASAMGITAAGTSGQVLVSNGTSAPTWTTLVTSITAQDDNTSDATYYPALFITTSGAQTTAKVSSTSLYFNPSTGTLNATIFNSLSDETRKTNVKEIEDATVTLNKISGVEFDWIDNGNHSSGVIAQELEKVLPFLIDTSSEGIKSVNYSGLIAYLIQSNKELSERIEKLEYK